MNTKKINKVIWIYWHDGWEKAPEICIKCLESWEAKNLDWEIKKLCAADLPKYINLNKELPGIESTNISLTSLSDVIRILLLEKYGGIWVDSTLLCRMPLDSWMSLLEENDFFAFSRPAPDRMVSSWFLTAKKGSYIIHKWKERIFAYWKNRNSTEDYFWLHHLFNELYSTDIEFKSLWDNTPKMSAAPPHYITPYEEKFFEKISVEKFKLIRRSQSPVFKLTYKYDTTKQTENTVLDYILTGNTIPIPMKIAVIWYGSFTNNGTVGDYLAVNTLTHFLKKNNFDFDCISYKSLKNLEGKTITLEETMPEKYDVIIFCCGPILLNHPHLKNLFEKFSHCYKIGISVSLFPKDHFNYYQPFDYVLPRENEDIYYEDIAIIAEPASEKAVKRSSKVTVGMALRNEQAEYGIEKCKSLEANTFLKQLGDELLNEKQNHTDKKLNMFRFKTKIAEKGNIIEIDNHLENSGKTPQEIEAQYSQCNIILTTRFHGAILALRNNIPVIAIDQIENGAKVFNLVSQNGYPFVWKINEVSYSEIEKIAKELLQGSYKDKIMAVKAQSRANAKRTLNQLHAHLLSFIPNPNISNS